MKTSVSPGRRAILLLLVVALGGLLLAQHFIPAGDASLEFNAPAAAAPVGSLVDERSLQTARRLGLLAASSQEQQYAALVLRTADHDVDIAFESALREATTGNAALSGKALTLSQQIDALEHQVKDDQQQIDRLPTTKASENDLGQTSEELQLAQMQLEVDRDELDDRHQDLIAIGGDRRARIQQALNEHEEVQKQADATPGKSLTAQLESPDALRTLPGKFRAYSSLSDRGRQLAQARQDAVQEAANLTRKHEELGRQAESTKASQTASRVLAQDAVARAAALDALKTQALNRQTLTSLDRRVQDAHLLATTYDSWAKLVVLQQRTVLRRILRMFAILVVLVSAIYLTVLFIEKFFDRNEADKRQRRNMRLVLSLGAQAVGVVLILLVVFGPPRETPTIIGLATAGLTVVLKDFIVAFFGWFALMGRNGMRIGDWVEINGVSGEVVEIGVFRTMLLETGNWTDAGHPTGRRVSFMNGFAIEGRYFNFSTAGQWLWDELRVIVPAGEGAFDKVDEIRNAVLQETKADMKQAEREWKNGTGNLVTGSFSAEPGVEMRPEVGGIQVIVRYITRAQERQEMRARLYAELIRIMHFSGQPAELVKS